MVKPKPVPFKKEPSDLVASTVACLSDAGMCAQHAEWVRKGGAALVVRFLDEQARLATKKLDEMPIKDQLRDLLSEAEQQKLAEKNPYEMSVDQQLTALRRANDEEKWGLTEADFSRLTETAPAWPQGKHAYRSFRIRFGEGSEGVQLTFERHVARIKSVFGESGFWRWEHLHSGKIPYKGKPVDRLRLLNGDHTHKAVIEWVIVDLGTHRKRDSVRAVRGMKSLADELLVVAWVFPDMIRAIDYDKLPGLFAAGYESNILGCGGAWRNVVFVSFDHDDSQVRVCAYGRGSGHSGYSVPVLRE